MDEPVSGSSADAVHAELRRNSLIGSTFYFPRKRLSEPNISMTMGGRKVITSLTIRARRSSVPYLADDVSNLTLNLIEYDKPTDPVDRRRKSCPVLTGLRRGSIGGSDEPDEPEEEEDADASTEEFPPDDDTTFHFPPNIMAVRRESLGKKRGSVSGGIMLVMSRSPGRSPMQTPDQSPRPSIWSIPDGVVLNDAEEVVTQEETTDVTELYYLENEWTFWFDKSGGKRNMSPEEYEQSVLELGSFNTVQGFWSYWNNLHVDLLRDNCNLRLFKKGTKPTWEDPVNREGGKWVVRGLPKERRMKYWSEMVLALIGEQLDDDSDSIVTGAVLSSRTNGDTMQLWVDGGHAVRTYGRERVKGRAKEPRPPIDEVLRDLFFPEPYSPFKWIYQPQQHPGSPPATTSPPPQQPSPSPTHHHGQPPTPPLPSSQQSSQQSPLPHHHQHQRSSPQQTVQGFAQHAAAHHHSPTAGARSPPTHGAAGRVHSPPADQQPTVFGLKTVSPKAPAAFRPVDVLELAARMQRERELQEHRDRLCETAEARKALLVHKVQQLQHLLQQFPNCWMEAQRPSTMRRVFQNRAAQPPFSFPPEPQPQQGVFSSYAAPQQQQQQQPLHGFGRKAVPVDPSGAWRQALHLHGGDQLTPPLTPNELLANVLRQRSNSNTSHSPSDGLSEASAGISWADEVDQHHEPPPDLTHSFSGRAKQQPQRQPFASYGCGPETGYIFDDSDDPSGPGGLGRGWGGGGGGGGGGYGSQRGGGRGGYNTGYSQQHQRQSGGNYHRTQHREAPAPLPAPDFPSVPATPFPAPAPAAPIAPPAAARPPLLPATAYCKKPTRSASLDSLQALSLMRARLTPLATQLTISATTSPSAAVAKASIAQEGRFTPTFDTFSFPPPAASPTSGADETASAAPAAGDRTSSPTRAGANALPNSRRESSSSAGTLSDHAFRLAIRRMSSGSACTEGSSLIGSERASRSSSASIPGDSIWSFPGPHSESGKAVVPAELAAVFAAFAAHSGAGTASE